MALRDLPVLGSQVGAPPKPAKGASRQQRRIARMKAGKAFREAVFVRDGLICQQCGRVVRRTLDVLAPDAAHIAHDRGRRVDPENRFNPDYARVTCSRCHLNGDHGFRL